MTPESCAKEIMENVAQALVGNTDQDIFQHACENAEKVIQRLLSSEVAKVHQEYQKLAESFKNCAQGWDDEANTPVADAYQNCAKRVEALAPNKEI